jgi:hypothetical protein
MHLVEGCIGEVWLSYWIVISYNSTVFAALRYVLQRHRRGQLVMTRLFFVALMEARSCET